LWRVSIGRRLKGAVAIAQEDGYHAGVLDGHCHVGLAVSIEVPTQLILDISGYFGQ
jgi:hypothetical protein